MIYKDNNNIFDYYHSLYEDNKRLELKNNIEKEIKNNYTNKYSDEDIINMLESFCIMDRLSLIIPYGMEDIMFSYLTPRVINGYSNILVQCKGKLNFYYGTTRENAKKILREGFKFESRINNIHNILGDVICAFQSSKIEIINTLYEIILEIEYDGVYYQAIEQLCYPYELIGECLLSNVFIKGISILKPITID
ncbi:hypothetical protein [Thomasclavelia spiroformis]|uniref:hypothetical protein n=1 Tax=Thomasclavelia spiroformis TaxID=29348 RepID=UPI0024B183FF|nr:hypothetical protein [Thomasclavelia spiroformis]